MRLGCCSWSLRPKNVDELIAGIQHVSGGMPGEFGVQLALDPLRRGEWNLEETRSKLSAAGIPILSGMMEMIGEDYSSLDTIRETGGVRVDEHWLGNLEAARGNAQLARALGLDVVTFHAGFLPHEASDPERGVMLDRLRQIAALFAEQGVRVGFETGQESAETLLGVLAEFGGSDVGVNFDPANMILYGMGDPHAALRSLSPHVVQVHLKDAIATRVPGTWGEEVTVGMGEVDFSLLVDILREHALEVDLVLEREAGEQRVEDLRAGLNHIRGCLGEAR